jgi:hypothetical protein
MMASTFRVGDNLGLEYGETAGENGWDDEYNDAMKKLDAVVQLSIKSVEAAQPGAPTEGDRYIASTTWGGACAANDIACYGKASSTAGAGWYYYAPKEGWFLWDRAALCWRFYYAALGWLIIPQIIRTENADVDTGTETVDSFADTICDGCVWDYVVKNSAGSDYRAGTVTAVWDAASDTVSYTEASTLDIGDTSGCLLSVAIAANVVTLSATVGSDNWSVRVVRRFI